MAGLGAATYGSVRIMCVTPEKVGEIESVREQILPEEIHLNQILEANHSNLISSGIAKKIEELSLAKYLSAHERLGRYCGATALRIDQNTQFQVSRHCLRGHPKNIEPIEIYIRTGINKVGHIYEIGHRAAVDDAEIELFPKEPFTEQEVTIATEMIDELEMARNTGDLPHLSRFLTHLEIASPSYVAYKKALGQEDSFRVS